MSNRPEALADDLGAVNDRDKGTRIDLARVATQLHGLAAALITTALLRFFPQSVETFGSAAAPLSAQISGSGPAAAALVVLCAAFLMSVGKDGGGKAKRGVV